MIEPRLHLTIEGPVDRSGSKVFPPQGLIRWQCGVGGIEPDEIQAVENSALWYTEGKGEEDLAVHFFDRHSARDQPDIDLSQPRTLETTLPMAPLSYSGVIVKVRWCIRLRVFLKSGKELFKEQSFRLSAFPPEIAEETSTDASEDQQAAVDPQERTEA